jgi:hypothetical protein
MMVRTVVLTALLLGIETAQAAVPEAVRQLPWRREVRLPAAPPPTDTWYVVEMDSLLAAVTNGDLGALRLVDDAGEPVAAVVLEPRWPAMHAEPVSLTDVRWTVDGDDRTRFSADIDLPPGDYLRAVWPTDAVAGVDVVDAERMPDWLLSDGWTALPNSHTHGIWRLTSPRARLSVQVARATTMPDLRLERLTLRDDRVRTVPFRARPGTFRGTTYEQVVDLPTGPHAVLSARVHRRADAAQNPVLLDLQRPGGGWERSASTACDSAQALTVLGFETQPILARVVRLSYDAADPPNAPFTVTAVEVVPPALAIPPSARPTLWLVYGDYAVPSPPGLAPDDLRSVRRLVPLALGAPQANPWFEENVLGTTWLRRRPAVLTVAMVVVLGIVAAVVLTERGARRYPPR